MAYQQLERHHSRGQFRKFATKVIEWIRNSLALGRNEVFLFLLAFFFIFFFGHWMFVAILLLFSTSSSSNIFFRMQFKIKYTIPFLFSIFFGSFLFIYSVRVCECQINKFFFRFWHYWSQCLSFPPLKQENELHIPFFCIYIEFTMIL